MKEILKGPSLVYNLVKKLKEKYPEKQIGKTVIQKLMYLIETKSDLDLGYTLYHYGPYSSMVNEYITLAETLGFVSVRWDYEKGYFIDPLKPNEDLLVDIEEKNSIKVIVDNYGNFTANELSIMTTALYIKNRFGVESPENIISAVLQAKPKNKKEWIEKILIKGGIVGESN